MVVIDPDNLDRYQVIFGTEAEKISLYPVSILVSALSSTGATTAASQTFTDSVATFVTDGVAVGDVIVVQNTLDSGHYIITSVDSETSLTVATDETFTAFEGSTDVVYTINEPSGGSIEPGVTLQALYSYGKEEWRTDLDNFGGDDLIRHTFPFEAITSEQFEIGGGNAHTDWTWQNDFTRKAVRTGGWADIITNGTTEEEYAGIITLGALDSDTQVYFQQVDEQTVPENFEFLGPVNEPINTFVTGDDKKGFLKLFARKKARTYAQSEIADIGVTTIQTIVNRFPLAHTLDAAISASDAQILGSAPFRNQRDLVTGQAVDLANVDGNTGTVTAAGATFQTDGVAAEDTVHILSGVHEGYYTIVSVTSETEIVVNTAEAGAFTAISTSADVTTTLRVADVSAGTASNITDGVTANVDDATGTLDSATGDFITRGVTAGDLLLVRSGGNIGIYTVISVDSATQVTVDTEDRPFDPESTVSYRIVLPGMYLTSKEDSITITATGDLTFTETGNTLERTTGSWVTDGVTTGTVVTVTNSASNNRSFTVASVTATTLTFISSDTVNDEGPTADPTVTAFDAYKRDIGGTIYAFIWRLTGNLASAANAYQFIQHQLRQPFDIDFGPIANRGDVNDLLMNYAAPTGTGLDMFIQNLAASDINNMTFQDATGINRQFPFLAAGDLNFNVNLVNDANAKFWLFFTDDSTGDNVGNNFGTENAIIVEDADGVPIAGNITGQANIAFTYDYDGNTQRGAGSAGTNASVTLVAIGLTTAQYVIASGTIARSVANVISAVAALERNYSNPS